jgi:Fe-S-cluster containining protein
VTSAALDCRTCHACCHGDERWVAVDRDDEARMGAPLAARVTTLVALGRESRARTLRMAAGRCVCLAADAGDGAPGCRIYAVRPGACRDVLPGDASCREARARLFPPAPHPHESRR